MFVNDRCAITNRVYLAFAEMKVVLISDMDSSTAKESSRGLVELAKINKVQYWPMKFISDNRLTDIPL